LGSPAPAQNWESVTAVDRDLVVRARGGDQDAFAEIVRCHQRRVYGVALRMTRRHEVADDIAQDTFVRAYRSLDRFELGRPLGPWLVKIAVNLSINYLNAPARREQALYTEESPDGPAGASLSSDPSREPLESNPMRCLASSELARSLAGALEKLTPEHRAVLLLKVDEGLRYDDIAETLGISRGTVMSRLFRARAHLKILLEDYR
jgi:RNA polymerase sigma-70 factor (ECF subfamily)